MSIACEKDITIKVVNPAVVPTAYWTLDEAGGSVDRVDSVTALALQPLGVTMPGAPALFSNGLHYTGAFGGNGYSTPFAAVLHYNAGDSSSLWGWFKINSTGIAGLVGGPTMEAVLGGSVLGNMFIAVGSSIDPNPVHIASHVDEVYLPAVNGQWYFFHIFYDGTLEQFGYSIDNGAETLFPTVTALGSGGSSVQSSNGWTGVNGDILFDEVGLLIDDKLTAAQVTYLYNSGAGRTWPL